ncbi:hypothetical protein [Dyella sp. 2RAB6]|uniref:hypothetical protein n=1 Tax=Dyella sp. 2RAB6 TaxID=3232992 RepID=UPI003F8F5097
MRYRVAGALLFSASLMMVIGTKVLAQSPSTTEQAQQANNERLLAAYKQSIEDARHGRYIDASFGLLKRLGLSNQNEISDPDVFDQWAQVMSCMAGAPTFNPAKQADFHVPTEQIDELRSATGVSAIRAIVERARRTRIVILDENHLDPRNRAFGLEVARALRPLGYTVLAAEALKGDADDGVAREKMAKLSADGYARQSTGYYFDDPAFADFLRQSLALGYRPVSYETTRTEYSKDAKVAQQQREQDQADNLMRRAVQAFPDAKILIYAGEHHAAERPIKAEDATVHMMADLLKRASGIDPLTIDQAGLSPIPMNRPDADLYAIASQKAKGQSVVLISHGKPLTTGLLAGSVDLQVAHPPVHMKLGRVDWLAALGRSPVAVPASLMPSSGTRLVQAFIATEAKDAIPVDQVLVVAGKSAPSLMLPHVAVRYVVQDWQGP